jgi:hypothetical protein
MKKYTYTIAIIALIFTAMSCSKSLDINEDPNNPTTVSPNLILPVGQKYTAFIEERDRGINHLGNMFMYNWSQADGFSWYNDEFLYLVTPSFYQRIFDYTYSNVLKQYQALENLDGEQYGYYHAIAKVMKAYHFQILVDTYGDVPYTEALQRGGNATPAYDDAEMIYDDLIVQLNEAIALINTTGGNADINPVTPGSDDAMFGGDMTSWKQFANNIKARILNRQSDLSSKQSYIQEEMAKTSADGFYTGNVGINPGYSQDNDRQNPKWDGFGQDVGGSNTLTNDATSATQYILDYLSTTDDPRIDYLYEEPETGHLGVPQGLTDYDVPVADAYVTSKVSNIGPGILRSPAQDAIIYTEAELFFNLAELAFKSLTSGDAQEYYEMGIEASFDYLGAEGASDYYNQNLENISWNASSDKIEAIITQKWLATNGLTAEQSWYDYNRTGFPENLPISLLASKPDRPVRLAYPSSELTSNGDNVPSQPDVFTSKIFWAN